MVVQVQTSFAMYCSQFLNIIFNNPIVMANPVALVFIISVIPSVFFPIPKAEFFIPILTNGGDASAVIIASTTGNIISELILYFLAKHGSAFLQRREIKKEIEIRHFIHRFSWIIFFFAPFIPIGTDILVVFAGLRNVKLHHFILPMSLGFAAKNIITTILVLQGLYFLPKILSICNGSP